MEEIRDIYSSYADPACTPLNETGAIEHVILYLQNLNNTLMKEADDNGVSYLYQHITDNKKPIPKSSDGTCNRWIYNLDYGYQSMTSDVSNDCYFKHLVIAEHHSPVYE